MYHPSRGGTRGGAAEFSWQSVKDDKDKTHYLGNTLMAATGRWQEGRDITWYTKDKKDLVSDETSNDQQAALEKRRTELAEIKRSEEEALAAALGFKPRANPLLSRSGDDQPRIGSALLSGSGSANKGTSANSTHLDPHKSKWASSGAANDGAGPSSEVQQLEARVSKEERRAAKKLAKMEVKEKRREEKRESRRGDGHERHRDERDRERHRPHDHRSLPHRRTRRDDSSDGDRWEKERESRREERRKDRGTSRGDDEPQYDRDGRHEERSRSRSPSRQRLREDDRIHPSERYSWHQGRQADRASRHEDDYRSRGAPRDGRRRSPGSPGRSLSPPPRLRKDDRTPEKD